MTPPRSAPPANPTSPPTTDPPTADSTSREPKAPRRPSPPLFTEPTNSETDQPTAAPADPLDSEGSAAGSRPGESGPGRRPGSGSRGRTDPLAFAEPIKAGVTVATAFANDTLSRDDDEREAELYLIDEADADGIAKPASRILTRRMREDGIVNPDLADAIAALVSLAAYVGKVLRRRAEFRRSRAGVLEPDEAAAA